MKLIHFIMISSLFSGALIFGVWHTLSSKFFPPGRLWLRRAFFTCLAGTFILLFIIFVVVVTDPDFKLLPPEGRGTPPFSLS